MMELTSGLAGRCLGPWSGSGLAHWAFPVGGIGAGMICLEGQGSFSHVSLRHRMERFHEPFAFACIGIPGRPDLARLVEGRVPEHKIFAAAGGGLGCVARSYGLPRFAESTAWSKFPFSRIAFSEEDYPLTAAVTAWSPFTPPDADPSSLPVGCLEYTFRNRTAERIAATFSFHSANFFVQEPGKQIIAGAAPGRYGVSRCDSGFTLWEDGGETEPARTSAFRVVAVGETAQVDPRWFRGGWYDAQTIVWRNARNAVPVDAPDYADEGPASPGGSLYVPIDLGPGEERTMRLLLSWHTPYSDLRYGLDAPAACSDRCDCGSDGANDCYEPGPRRGISQHLLSEYVRPAVPPAAKDCHRPWYASAFVGIDALDAYWRENHADLRARSWLFAETFHDTTLPDAVLEAVSANLSILKSPTVMRQFDGRFWAWEGCRDASGCCFGSCTHVWNYAHAVAHLFPALERGLREAEFNEGQNALGHQLYRLCLPLRPGLHDFLAAADGQLGGIVKAYRDWRIGGDTDWLRRLWPRIVDSLEYCINAWDPDRSGRLVEPHHVTYDIEFWGAESLTSSFYAAALKSAIDMAEALGEPVRDYPAILAGVSATMSGRLFNGEYFQQELEWRDARRGPPEDIVRHPKSSPYWQEALDLMEAEGPKYQLGSGCLADGVIGDWMARSSGLGPVLDEGQTRSHIRAVWTHNFREDLSRHENPQRPGYALGREGGLLLCTWPRGEEPTLPFIYSNEVWTGIEYQVAAHAAMMGESEIADRIVETVRSRYRGDVRNPFNEYECGHFYARALASWTLLQAHSGVRYDAVERKLVLEGRVPSSGRFFIATATGYGLVEWKDGRPVLDVRSGAIPLAG